MKYPFLNFLLVLLFLEGSLATCYCNAESPIVMIQNAVDDETKFWCATGNMLRKLEVSRSDLSGEVFEFKESVYAFDLRKNVVVVGGGTPGESAFLQKLDIVDDQTIVVDLPSVESLFKDTIFDLAISPKGDAVVVGSLDGNAVVLFLEGDKPAIFLTGHSGGITGVRWLHDHRVITSSRDGTLRVWGIGSESEPIRERVLNQHVGEVLALAVAPKAGESVSGNPIVASIGEDKTIRFWQPTVGRMMRFYRFVDDQPTSLAWDQDGVTLLVGTRRGKVFWVDSRTAMIVKESTAATEAIFTIVALGDQKKALIGTANGTLKRVE